jgi:thioredoxin-related protein
MLISGEYAEKIIIREIIINTGSMLIDFNGKKNHASNLADSYNIKVTPTLLFLGPKGEELVDRIVGINTIELFSYYVDQAIDRAILNFKSP